MSPCLGRTGLRAAEPDARPATGSHPRPSVALPGPATNVSASSSKASAVCPSKRQRISERALAFRDPWAGTEGATRFTASRLHGAPRLGLRHVERGKPPYVGGYRLRGWESAASRRRLRGFGAF